MDIDSFWAEIINHSQSIESAGFNLIARNINPLMIKSNTLYLLANNDFIKSVIESNYRKDIEKEASEVYGENIFVQVVTENDINDKDFDEKEKDIEQKAAQIIRTTINPKYTFENFVQGSSNEFAYSTCLSVADSPAEKNNPLFIHGGVGLGKTHLMHAIGNRILNRDPDAKILYISTETFVNELINSIKDNKNEEFRNKYRKNVDILMVDDVQFLEHKESTQEEFFHTFNTLYNAKKQIIISSDKPPKDIATLEERLRSRFEMGVMVDIIPPDFETRMAILRKRAQTDKLHVPDDVNQYIARNIRTNIRQLEGALNTILALSQMKKSPITYDLAVEALQKNFNEKETFQISINIIKNKVCSKYNVTEEELDSKIRKREITEPRQIAMFLARELIDISLPKIGESFGKRDHTTVIHAINKIEKRMKSDAEFKAEIEKIIQEIKNL